MTAGLTIRPVEPRDLHEIAHVHIAAFPEAALTRLGHETVRRYYAWQGEPVHQATGLVAVRSASVVGFCFSGVFAGALSGFIRRNAWFLLGAVLRHPQSLANAEFRARLWSGGRLMWRVAGNAVRSGDRKGKPSAAPAPAPAYGILAIATHPDHEGTGIGRALMAAAEADAIARAFARMYLSVHPSNTRAVRFYEALGWEKVGGMRWKGEMRRSLGTRAADGHPSIA